MNDFINTYHGKIEVLGNYEAVPSNYTFCERLFIDGAIYDLYCFSEIKNHRWKYSFFAVLDFTPENVLILNFNRCNFQTDLEKFLPCSIADFKKLLSMVELCADQWEKVKQIYNYIKSKVVYFQNLRKESCSEKEKANYTATIKKFIKLSEVIGEKYGFSTLSDELTLNMKKTTFYTFIFNGAENKKDFSTKKGYIFEKDGVFFTAAKTGKIVEVFHAASGLLFFTCSNYKEVSVLMVEKINLLKNLLNDPSKEEQLKDAIETMIDLLTAAGISVPDYMEKITEATPDLVETVETMEKTPEPAETTKTASKTAETIEPEETKEATEKAPEKPKTAEKMGTTSPVECAPTEKGKKSRRRRTPSGRAPSILRRYCIFTDGKNTPKNQKLVKNQVEIFRRLQIDFVPPKTGPPGGLKNRCSIFERRTQYEKLL